MNHPEVTERYCPLLKRMQLTGRECKSPLPLTTAVKSKSIPVWRAFFKFIASLQSKFCEGLTTQNTTENDCITHRAKNTTALQPSVFLTGICRLLVTRHRRLFQAQTTAKVNCRFHSQYLYLVKDLSRSLRDQLNSDCNFLPALRNIIKNCT